VTLRAERVGDDVEVHVVDGGPGMSTSDRARAFDRFWRRDGTRWDGTGLGLAIAAQLVRTSGGSTWLDEADGGGIDAVVQLELAERPGAASRTRHGEPLAGSEA
jgi:signal transduction histidine kinase